MVRLAVVISVFALFACSGSDTSQTGDAGGVPPVGATAEEAAVAPEVQSCLDLIRQSEFQQALPVCVAALEIDPDNQQVREAVALAGPETTKRVAAERAGGAVAEGAAEEATSKLGEAAAGMADEAGR